MPTHVCASFLPSGYNMTRFRKSRGQEFLSRIKVGELGNYRVGKDLQTHKISLLRSNA